MKAINHLFATITRAAFMFASISSVYTPLHAQPPANAITVYQYRHVPDSKIDEFIKRETTYWSKVAKKAVDNKKMTFWALLEKVGGYDLPNSSNYLFVNTFSDIDKVGEVFNAPEKITGVPLIKMETNSMSTTTSEIFLHDAGWAQAATANPDADFHYVVMIYHNSSDADSLLGLENKYWSPFIQKAMDNKQTPQLAWGNARILSPSGDDIKFNSVSYDLFKTLKDALMPNWDAATVFPNDGLTKINALEKGTRHSDVYRIVKVVAAQ